MRFAGRISGWNDDKGYGFVVPHDGGDRAFVHIKAFQFGSRRPVDGDLVSYTVAKDGQGRANATEIRFAGQRIATRTQRKPLPRLAIGGLILVGVAAGTLFAGLPAVVLFLYVVLSGISYFMYASDKAAAGKGQQRTREASLHFIDLLGGWPGALIAQQRSRHKTAKASFQSVFWFTVVANIALTAWFVHSGLARSLTDSDLPPIAVPVITDKARG